MTTEIIEYTDAARIAELERQIAKEKRRQAEENARVRREQEAENNRVVAIKAKITQIHDIAFGGFQWNSDRLKQMIQEVEAIDPEQGFDEFKDDAIRVKRITLAELTSVLEQQQQFEEERAEAEQIRPIYEFETNLIGLLKDLADKAYCEYIDRMRRDECLGWETKVKRGLFGAKELKAHIDAAEILGRHRAFIEAAKLVHEAIKNAHDI